MEPKKISFGFSKISKKPNLLLTKENSKTDTKVELIKCLEGQKIKLVEEKPEEKPLLIPLKGLQKTSTALASLLKRRAVLLGEDEPEENSCITIQTSISTNNDEPEDIEKRAARELLAEIQNNGSTDPANKLVLPVFKPDDLPLDGAKESSLNDYENIPIQDFGKAMLRGMGWTEPLRKDNQKGGPPKDDTHMVRPKGMGLGADKALNKKTTLVAPDANEVLEIKRNAFVCILGGKHKDLYGQIDGFDDHAGRVIVKLAIGGAKESFNEFLCQPVSRKEFAQYGKCINSSKYDEYKKKENEYGQIILKKSDEDFMKKTEKNFKTECQDSVNYKRRDYKDDFEKTDRYKYYKEQKHSKQEKDTGGEKDENRRHVDYENDTYSGKHKKSKKSHSKKSKKSKSKYKDTLSDSCSSDYSSDSEEETRKKHKKKTKKSKKPRERSRSRGRR